MLHIQLRDQAAMNDGKDILAIRRQPTIVYHSLSFPWESLNHERSCWFVSFVYRLGYSFYQGLVNIHLRTKAQPHLGYSPWAIVFLSSRRLRKDSEATWGFPHRAVSSSTSSSNLIQRAVSFQCMSWFFSTTNSFNSTNTCQRKERELNCSCFLCPSSFMRIAYLAPIAVVGWCSLALSS